MLKENKAFRIFQSMHLYLRLKLKQLKLKQLISICDPLVEIILVLNNVKKL